MFSRSVEYAINLLSVMPAVGETESAKELAKKAKVPEAYASKVMQYLRDAGIVASHRGVGGGVTLLKPANKVSLAEIVDAIQGKDDVKKGSTAASIYDKVRKLLEKEMLPATSGKAKPKAKAKSEKAKTAKKAVAV